MHEIAVQLFLGLIFVIGSTLLASKLMRKTALADIVVIKSALIYSGLGIPVYILMFILSILWFPEIWNLVDAGMIDDAAIDRVTIMLTFIVTFPFAPILLGKLYGIRFRKMYLLLFLANLISALSTAIFFNAIKGGAYLIELIA